MFNRFQKWAIATTVATYFLIIVGGFVRVAGAGMGCPDWPKCFDKWIPPTHISELPQNIDPSLFNVKLAWIEYINRLIGVSTGFLIFTTMVLAIKDYRKSPRILYPTILAFVGVAFEGWLGKLVVNSNLDPIMVSIHLAGAWIVVLSLQYAMVCAFFKNGSPLPHIPIQRKQLGTVSTIIMAILFIQLSVGAWLRGAIETSTKNNIARSQLINIAGISAPIHQILGFSLALSIAVVYLWIKKNYNYSKWFSNLALALLITTITQVCLGIILQAFALPKTAQLFHLFFGTCLMGLLSALILVSYRLPVDSSSTK